MKKILIFSCFISILFVFGAITLKNNINTNFLQISSDIENIIGDKLDNFDLSQIDNILAGKFNGVSFIELVKQIISGKLEFNSGTFINYIFNLFGSVLKEFIAPFILIFVLCTLGYIFRHLSSEKFDKSIGNIIHLGIICIVGFIIFKIILNILLSAKDTLLLIQSIMQVVFPITLTLMASLGASTSVSIYQPIMALLSSTIVESFINLLMPLFICSLVLNIVNSFTDNVKVSKFSDLISKIFKWTVGIIFFFVYNHYGYFWNNCK